MFSGFTHLFNDILEQNMQAFADVPNNTKTPPASKKAIETLPMVKITADDLLEETNKECLVCLEEQKLGTFACKLQCGHIFHRECVTEWLAKQCTCPVCRFEIETDDNCYEVDRKKRMKKRKLRYREDEIKNMNMSKLKNLAKTFEIDISHCIDKSEVVNLIISSGRINITQGLPPMTLSKSQFENKSVSELRHLLLSFGLSDEGAIEKSDLRSRLLDSGRILINEEIIIEENLDERKCEDIETEEGLDFVKIEKEDLAELSESSHSNMKQQSIDESKMKLSELKLMDLNQIKSLCKDNGINVSGCIDKSEMIERILMSDKLNIDNTIPNFPIYIKSDDFNSIPVSELKHICMNAGLSSIGIHSLTNQELRNNLISSRIVILTDREANNKSGPEPESEEDKKEYEFLNFKNCSEEGLDQFHSLNEKSNILDESASLDSAPNLSNSSHSQASEPENHENQQYKSESTGHHFDSSNKDDRYLIDNESLKCLSIKELKSLLCAFDIDFRDCVEKEDLLYKFEEAANIKLV